MYIFFNFLFSVFYFVFLCIKQMVFKQNLIEFIPLPWNVWALAIQCDKVKTTIKPINQHNFLFRYGNDRNFNKISISFACVTSLFQHDAESLKYQQDVTFIKAWYTVYLTTHCLYYTCKIFLSGFGGSLFCCHSWLM